MSIRKNGIVPGGSASELNNAPYVKSQKACISNCHIRVLFGQIHKLESAYVNLFEVKNTGVTRSFQVRSSNDGENTLFLAKPGY